MINVRDLLIVFGMSIFLTIPSMILYIKETIYKRYIKFK